MKNSVLSLNGALVVAALLMGCKGDSAPTPEVKSDPSAKSTEAAKPAESAKPAMTAASPGSTLAASPTAAAPAAAATSAAAASSGMAAPGAGGEVPAIPDGKSAPPSATEWQSAPSVNTVGANSAPRDCEMKIVREWLKVNCTGNIKEIQNMDGFGVKGSDYFELVTLGKVADFVVRMKKGKALKVRIIREGQSASLFVNWPTQSPKPSIVALQIFNP